MFGNKKKTIQIETCNVCQKPAVLSKTTKILDGNTPASEFTLNEHSHPFAELPYTLYLCAECTEIVSGFILYLIEEKKKAAQEEELMERLKTLNVGTVLTVIEEFPHPMPTDDIKQMLESSPFSQIWNQEL